MIDAEPRTKLAWRVGMATGILYIPLLFVDDHFGWYVINQVYLLVPMAVTLAAMIISGKGRVGALTGLSYAPAFIIALFILGAKEKNWDNVPPESIMVYGTAGTVAGVASVLFGMLGAFILWRTGGGIRRLYHRIVKKPGSDQGTT